jgi:hypothetical protein
MVFSVAASITRFPHDATPCSDDYFHGRKARHFVDITTKVYDLYYDCYCRYIASLCWRLLGVEFVEM